MKTISDTSRFKLPLGTRVLGWSGLLPFLATLALAVLAPGARILASSMFIAYGAVILSFIGGTRWGSGLAMQAPGPRLVESVLPSLLGFGALLLVHTPAPALAVLAAGFAAWLVIDLRDRTWSPAYRHMRLGISITVLALHAAWIVVL
ncbi:DUF3429 domain-containing protein [Oleiagrimonas sp.]|jgi:hypothetical protein|uniref:DUF3429 domain-containing protein n=1 Tax=Oleiagrimonas sp. TaxID=2010330 RepID=UPI00262F576C|nr:DUF3429 domain-containing protein [Oleiagrimonas sp.]MDA3913449.1 DUF3429 domain-containing protein [Oleiagrimonas sp.]